MAAGATAKAFVPLPVGSRINSIRRFNAAAYSGTPTNINLTVGTTDGGAEVVAATDIKAIGAADLTIAQTAAGVAATQSSPNGYWVQTAAVGGTNPAGSVVVDIYYFPPNP